MEAHKSKESGMGQGSQYDDIICLDYSCRRRERISFRVALISANNSFYDLNN